MLKIYKKRIICAGGYRSGSTWQYNVVRMIFSTNKIDFICGDPAQIHFDFNKSEIIKSHNYRPELVRENTIVLTTIRDIRDVIASAFRRKMLNVMTNNEIDNKKSINFANQFVDNYYKWKNHSACETRYENMFNDRLNSIKEISLAIGLKVDAHQIDDLVQNIEMPKINPDFISHLWPNHITNGVPNTYQNYINKELIQEIEHCFDKFITNEGYDFYQQ